MNYDSMTPAALVRELKKRDRAVARLEYAVAAANAESAQGRNDAGAAEHRLSERIKELNCLYVLSSYLDAAALKPEQALRKVPALLKKSLQFPRDTCARVVFAKKTYATGNYRASRWKLAADITVSGKKAGIVEVRYLVKKPAEAEGPFLREERHLIDEVAERISRGIERARAQQDRINALRQQQAAEQQLRAFNQQLIASNQQLRAVEQQLRAANQQLHATEQQLRASNQQLAASEAAIRNEQQRTMAVFDNFPEILYVVDPDTYEVLFVNEAFKKILGTDPVGKKCYRAFQGFSKPCDFCTNALLRKNKGKPYRWEYHNEKLGRTFSITDQLIDWPDGRKVRFEYAADITVQKQAADQIQSLFNGIDDVIYVSDPDTYELLFVNDAFKAFWGSDPVGQKCHKVLQDRDEPCPFCTNRIIFDEKPGETHVWEFQNELTKQWFRCADKAIMWPDGRNVRFEIAADITEQKKAADTLNREKEFSDTLINSLPGVFYMIDKEGKFVRWNRRFEEMAGLPSEEFGRHSPLDVFRGEEREHVAERIAAVFTEGEATAEAMLHSADGSAVPYHFTGVLISYDHEPYLVGIGVDISEQRKLSAEVRERELQYRTMFENINEGFALHEIIVDDTGKPVDYRYLAINPAFEKLTGLPAGPSIGKTVCEILPGTENDPADWIGRFGRVALTGEPLTVEDYSAPLGKWFLVNGFCPKRGQFAVTFTDITDRKNLLARLTAEKDKLELFMENASDMITQVDAEGNFIYVNRIVEKYLGISAGDAIGKSAFGFIHPDDQADTGEKFQRWIRDRVESASFENRQVSARDGHVTPMLWTINPRFDTAGNLESVWSVARDISERVKMELDLKYTMTNLERSNKELEQFAYVASHDLQEPLRMVGSYVELLADRYRDKLDQDAQDFIGFAVDGAVRMQRLIRDLLSFSRVSTQGKEFEPVDMNGILENVTESLEMAIEEKKAEVTVGELPTVNADPSQMLQLLQNLVQNGLKFVDGKAPEVGVSARREGGEWIFSVADNGIGIDPQYFDKVFIIFQRLHGKAQYGGTGIGLAVCKRIVERHGGRIWIESEPGNGTTFHFTVPV